MDSGKLSPRSGNSSDSETGIVRGLGVGTGFGGSSMLVGNTTASLHGSAARMSSLPLNLPGAHNQMFGWNMSSPSPSTFLNNETSPELIALMANSAANSSVPANERLTSGGGRSGAGKRNKSTIPPGAVRKPFPKDVLLGRGKPFQLWKGNQQMLNLIDKLRPKYDAVPRNEKGKYIEEVLRRVKSDGGKFMERHITSDDTPYWIEVTRSKAYYKVGHAFRSTSNRNQHARTVKTVHGGNYDGTESPESRKTKGGTFDLGEDTKRTSEKKKAIKITKPSKGLSKKKMKSPISSTSLKSDEGTYTKSSTSKKSWPSTKKEKAFAMAQSASTTPAVSMKGVATLSAQDEYRQRLLAQEELLHKKRINAILAAGGTPLPSHSSDTFIGTSSMANQNALLEELRQREAMMMMQSQTPNEALFLQRQLRSTPLLTNNGLDLGIRQRQQQQQHQHQLQALKNRFSSPFLATGMSQSQGGMQFSGMSSNQIHGQNFGMNPNVYETLMARQSSSLDSEMSPQFRAGFTGSGGLTSNFGMMSTNTGLPSMNQMVGQQHLRDQLVPPNVGRSNTGVSGMFLPNQQLNFSGKVSPATTKITKKNTPKDLLKSAGGVAPKKG